MDQTIPYVYDMQEKKENRKREKNHLQVHKEITQELVNQVPEIVGLSNYDQQQYICIRFRKFFRLEFQSLKKQKKESECS